MNLLFNTNKTNLLGFNTSGNSQTSGRSTQSILLGKLRNTSGSTTRKFKYCNSHSPDLNYTFRCVFDIPNPPPLPPAICYYQPDAYFSTFRGNDTNFYGKSIVNGVSNLQTIVYNSLSEGFSERISTSSCVIDKDGNIYICGSISQELFCFNYNCSLKWRYDTTSQEQGGCGSSIPIIGCDGTIYFSCTMLIDNQGNRISKLFAINPDGTLKWKTENLSGSADGTMPIIGPNYNIFLATGLTAQVGYNYVIDKNGNIIKTYSLENQEFNGLNISADVKDNLVYLLGCTAPFFYIINTSVNSVKTVSLNATGRYCEPVSIGNSVYLGTSEYIYKINKFTGSIENSLNTVGISYDSTSPIVDNDNNLYYVGYLNNSTSAIYKFNSNLQSITSVQFSQSQLSSLVMGKNNLIYANDLYFSIIYCLDTNLQVISSFNYSGYGVNYSNSTPVIGKNGLIYINTTNGLIAIG